MPLVGTVTEIVEIGNGIVEIKVLYGKRPDGTEHRGSFYVNKESLTNNLK